MIGLLDSERSRSRRERTFVGSECAVCEEPLEHTLSGERVLQFTCGHVSHGACFHEFIRDLGGHLCPSCDAPLSLDTSRAGNALDLGIGALDSAGQESRALDSAGQESRALDAAGQTGVAPPRPHSLRTAPLDGASLTPWESQSLRSVRPPSLDSGPEPKVRGSVREARLRARGPAPGSHNRSDSDVLALNPPHPDPYTDTIASATQRFDGHSETTSIAPSRMPKHPIPPPLVTIRSEFPTLTRSRHQQTLTCLLTIEVPDYRWMPDPEDLPPLSLLLPDDRNVRPPSPAQTTAAKSPSYESADALEHTTDVLRSRVDNWHGLDFSRFGKLRLHASLQVGKDKQTWQELECYLFAEMLICIKEKRVAAVPASAGEPLRKSSKCTLKGSILIKKHLDGVTRCGPGSLGPDNPRSMDELILTLSLSVAELPSFHLKFDSTSQLKLWQQALLDLNSSALDTPLTPADYDLNPIEAGDDEWQRARALRGSSSTRSGRGSSSTAPADPAALDDLAEAIHVPIDIVVVIPISSSMQGVKIGLVRDTLRFMIATLGERDRLGIVTFGSDVGGVPLVGLTTKAWTGWPGVLASIKPVGQKSFRADVVEGANVAMDLIMQRRVANPIGTILLISDSSMSETDGLDFVTSRAEAAKIAIHSFGLGMTHKPDTMIELSTRTKASYTYVKDWMMLRECLAGCLGALQSTSHQNVRLKLRLPEGSPASFVKISGALQITKRATGRDAEAALGDLRFGDKRDVLVQLVIAPDMATNEAPPQDPWESIVSGLEALGGSIDAEDQSTLSVEELPLIQADLTWADLLSQGTTMQLPRPTLLAITMLPAAGPTRSAHSSQMSSPLMTRRQGSNPWPAQSPIPPHPLVVQRRMELLTSDMLTRGLTLVSRGQHERAAHLLNETRSILKGLGKGGLPPIPPMSASSATASPVSLRATNSLPTQTREPAAVSAGLAAAASALGAITTGAGASATLEAGPSPSSSRGAPAGALRGSLSAVVRTRSQDTLGGSSGGSGIDALTVAALDAELEAALEWMGHPAVFARDSRKSALQAIGVIACQRGYTFRTPVEALWAGRVAGVKRCMARSRAWREQGNGIVEEG